MSVAFESLLSTPEMLATFGERALVQAMMDFEAALARSEAAEGLIPAQAASAIAGVCRAELYDVAALVAASGRAGCLAVPLVDKLTETVALFDPDAAQAVHWGSTSQDVIDTAMVLLTRRALALIDRDLSALIASLLALAERHRATPQVGRTLMQPAPVVSFGFKAAGWAAALLRGQQRLHEAGARALQLQLGGAVGTLAGFGAKGTAVAARVADTLGLPPPPHAWHTQRDDWVALGCAVGVLVGTLSKVARDLSLLAQTEVGEITYPARAASGARNAAVHDRDPVSSLIALASAQRVPHRVAALLGAMAQEHERGLGGWQAELAEWCGLFTSAHGALKALCDAAEGLQVHPGRMREHIDALHGLASADAAAMHIAAAVGKPRAQAMVGALSRRAASERRPLGELVREAVAGDDILRRVFGDAEIDALFDPQQAAGAASARTDEALARLRPLAAALAAAKPWHTALNEEVA